MGFLSNLNMALICLLYDVPKKTMEFSPISCVFTNIKINDPEPHLYVQFNHIKSYSELDFDMFNFYDLKA